MAGHRYSGVSAAMVIGLAVSLALAADTAPAKRSWLKKSAIDVPALLPPPPKADSAEVREELALLEKLQQSRTPEDVARCSAEVKLTMAAFQSVMGDNFTAENLPTVNALLEDAAGNSKSFSKVAKATFNRVRPALADSKLKPAVEPDDEPSYPSGHSTRGMIFAIILAELEPGKKADLLARGQEIGFDRVIAGCHYPSDVAAGRVLGQETARLLLADPTFREDLAKAKAEYDAAKAHAALPSK